MPSTASRRPSSRSPSRRAHSPPSTTPTATASGLSLSIPTPLPPRASIPIITTATASPPISTPTSSGADLGLNGDHPDATLLSSVTAAVQRKKHSTSPGTSNATYHVPATIPDPSCSSGEGAVTSDDNARAVTGAMMDDATGGDSSDTVYWGWVVLIATWIVVVSGVGSVTGVWEWAWGVEEKRKWPQSIDAEGQRFPIPGYYPAMVILTGVMAWVWVIFAWVGIKYFKHAKIQG